MKYTAAHTSGLQTTRDVQVENFSRGLFFQRETSFYPARNFFDAGMQNDFEFLLTSEENPRDPKF